MTNQDRELLEKALEALEETSGGYSQNLIAALRERLAQPADASPDPLHLSRILHELAGAASLCWTPHPSGVFDSQEAIKHVESAIAEIRERLAQQVQEPLAWANKDDLQNFDMRVRTNCDLMHTVPLYTTPQPRQWVGLTDEEMVDLQDRCGISIHQSDFEAIGAKLKQKNGYAEEENT